MGPALFILLWYVPGLIGLVQTWRKGYLRSLVRWSLFGWIFIGWFVVYVAVAVLVSLGLIVLAISYLLPTRWGYLDRQ